MKTRMTMKRITGNFKTLILFCSLTVTAESAVAQFTQKRIFERTEPVNRETTLEIGNKYGNIEITEWKRDSVLIRAEIEANASNQSRTDKMIKGIEIEITSSKYLLRAQTTFAQTLNVFLESFKGMTNKIISYDSRVQINYYIKAPAYINLKIDNKYGDIYLEESRGNVDILLSNGSLKARSLTKRSSLSLSFCNAVINKAEDCKTDASFSEILIDDAEDLLIKSVSSKFEIKNVGNIDVESRRDKYYIGKINSLRGNSYFSQFKINQLAVEVAFNARYGNITAETIESNFRTIEIEAGYNDLNLTFDPSASYFLEIRHLKSSVTLPISGAGIEKRVINEDRREYIYEGAIGKNPGSRKVRITTSMGNIIIR